MADAGVPRQGAHVAGAEDVAHQPAPLVHRKVLTIAGGDAGGILATMLQQQQTVIQQLVDRRCADSPQDPTHMASTLEK